MKHNPLSKWIPLELLELYEVHNYRHAAEVLKSAYGQEFEEILNCLKNFRLTLDDIKTPGGNESIVPKKFSKLLRPLGWKETRISGDLVVTLSSNDNDEEKLEIKNYLDGHKIDYVKNGVAYDLEWNSKDQTFDRDLYAFRAFHECSLIGAAIIVTRSGELNEVFDSLGKDIKGKYGASTTWMGKLLYRLNAGRHGGCPVLVFGITPRLITDWKQEDK